MAKEIKLITVCSLQEHAKVLETTADRHGWDLDILEVEWKGFGTKLLATKQHLENNPGIERFVFCDAYDVIVFGSPEEFKSKIHPDTDMIVSAERGLWPPTLHPFRSCYFNHDHRFNYPNSGLYYAKSKFFLRLLNEFPPFNEIDDQYWMNILILLRRASISIDSDQEVFNSHSFMSNGDYGYENNRIQILGNQPIFVHSNGRTTDERLNELVKSMI